METVFPVGSRVLETRSYGSSAWTRTARIQVELPDGSTKLYFMKVVFQVRKFGFNLTKYA
jgi:hypothetical protein